MNFKKIILGFALTALVGAPLMGCEPNDPQTGDTKIEISFAHTFGQTIQDNLNPQIEKFEELCKTNLGVDVEVTLVPYSNYDTILDGISKGLAVGNIPKIAVAYPDHVADYLKEEGETPGKYVVNFNDYINNSTYGLGKESWLGDANNDSMDDFIDAYIDEGQHFTKEGLYTFPYMKSTEAMLYNYDAVETVLSHYKPEFQGSKSLIEEYMESLDWDEFMNLCEQVNTYKNEINPDLAYPAFYDSDSNLFISQMFQSNIPYSSIIEGVGHIDFATGEARTRAEAMVQNLKNNYDDHLFTTKGCFSTYGSDSFKNVESVFVIGSTGGSGYSLTSAFNMGVCKVPSVNAGNQVYVSQGPDLIILKNPKLSDSVNALRSEYAWRLIKYLTNKDNNCKICLKGSEGYLPVRKSAYETSLFYEFLDSGEFQAEIASLVYNDIDGSYFNTPSFCGSSDLRTEVGGIITLSLSGTSQKSISDIFSQAISNATMKIR